jgi:hypothetical protein
MRNRIEAFYRSYRTELIIFLISIPYLIAQTLNGGDFRILLKAAAYFRNGISPYGIVMHISSNTTDVFLYSPFVGFILAPLTHLPEFVIIFIFCLINFFILFRIWAIMVKWLNIDRLSEVQKKWWFILSVAFIMRFILHNFEKTQMNIVVFYLSFEGLYQIFLRGRAMGGILLALGICIKLLPLIFLPYLLYRKKAGLTFGIILLCGLLLLLPSIWYGFAFDRQLLQGWWSAINPTLEKYNSQQNTSVYFHCISALIPVYFSDCSYHGLSVNIMNLKSDQLFLLINIIRLVLAGVTIWFLWVGSIKKHLGIFLFWELAYLFLLIPLLFPHQQKYSYINLLPAYGYIAYYLVNTFSLSSPEAKRDKAIMLVLVTVIVLLTIFTADIFWGYEIGKYFQFMKLITVGTLILIPVLAYFSPARLQIRLILTS